MPTSNTPGPHRITRTGLLETGRLASIRHDIAALLDDRAHEYAGTTPELIARSRGPERPDIIKKWLKFRIHLSSIFEDETAIRSWVSHGRAGHFPGHSSSYKNARMTWEEIGSIVVPEPGPRPVETREGISAQGAWRRFRQHMHPENHPPAV